MKIIFEKKKKRFDLLYSPYRRKVWSRPRKWEASSKSETPGSKWWNWMTAPEMKNGKNISLPRVCGSYFGKSDQNTQKVKHDAFFFFFFIGQCKTECKFSGKMTQCTGQTDGEIEWKKRCNLVYGLNRVCALVRPSHIKDCKTSDLSTVYSFHFSVSAELLPSLVLTARTVHATNL